jgi:hypothetical protein
MFPVDAAKAMVNAMKNRFILMPPKCPQ